MTLWLLVVVITVVAELDEKLPAVIGLILQVILSSEELDTSAWILIGLFLWATYADGVRVMFAPVETVQLTWTVKDVFSMMLYVKVKLVVFLKVYEVV